jgi:hypothetical protein
MGPFRKRFTSRSSCAVETQLWTLAESVALAPDPQLAGSNRGSIRACRHATGWFLSGRYDPTLSAEAIEHFRHFIVVRTYLLLAAGAACAQWTASPEDDALCADWTNISPAELDYAMARF